MNQLSKQVMIVAGEASGDMHGARLVESLFSLNPALIFSGIGGQELASAGVEMLYDASKLAVVGLTEVVSHLGDILAARKALVKQMVKVKPSLLILIDYPDFNLLLAAKAKKLGIPVFYYISPQVWAWRSGRVKKIGQLTKKVAVILPFEKDFYKDRGVAVDFVGHPLVDTVKAAQSRDIFLQKNNINITPETKIVGLLPGSRSKEIRSLLPDFLEAAYRLSKNTQQSYLFLLPQASTISDELLAENGLTDYQNRLNIHTIRKDRYSLMASCDAVVAASGTVTLELALLGTPVVTTYRVSPKPTELAECLFVTYSFSLVNLVAGRKIIPELLQDQVSPDAIADALHMMLTDHEYRLSMIQGLAEVAEKLGTPGCSLRAAKLALTCMED